MNPQVADQVAVKHLSMRTDDEFHLMARVRRQ